MVAHDACPYHFGGPYAEESREITHMLIREGSFRLETSFEVGHCMTLTFWRCIGLRFRAGMLRTDASICQEYEAVCLAMIKTTLLLRADAILQRGPRDTLFRI